MESYSYGVFRKPNRVSSLNNPYLFTYSRYDKETDLDYYYTGNSENAKGQWYTKEVVLLQDDIAAGDTVLLTSAGGSGAAGEVMLVLEIGHYAA